MRVGNHFKMISNDYLDFLRNHYDSKVPKNSYENTNKFFFGVTTMINGHLYYVPVSSFHKQQKTNMLIKNRKNQAISSLRFSFMIPIPKKNKHILKSLDLTDMPEHYKNLVEIEENFCVLNQDRINQIANYVYRKSQSNIQFKKICCDFKMLEEGCKEWVFQHLQIHFKDNPRRFHHITDCSDAEILKWIDISDYGELTRIEHIENDYSNVHTIKIYAEDEFCNEKSLSVSVPLENVCVH